MKLIFIRHGQTFGNLEKRYIGTTDEPLFENGIKALQKKYEDKLYPSVNCVFTSPLKRCIQTAKIIYPKLSPKVIDDFRECDFGDFEGKNYIELSENTDYQAWIDSGGELAFPNGESKALFTKRVVSAFEKVLSSKLEDTTAFIVHGGTIMAIMEQFAYPKRNYFDWTVKNGHGFICTISDFNYDKKIVAESEI